LISGNPIPSFLLELRTKAAFADVHSKAQHTFERDKHGAAVRGKGRSQPMTLALD
jgi:hypothetical protein